MIRTVSIHRRANLQATQKPSTVMLNAGRRTGMHWRTPSSRTKPNTDNQNPRTFPTLIFHPSQLFSFGLTSR